MSRPSLKIAALVVLASVALGGGLWLAYRSVMTYHAYRLPDVVAAGDPRDIDACLRQLTTGIVWSWASESALNAGVALLDDMRFRFNAAMMLSKSPDFVVDHGEEIMRRILGMNDPWQRALYYRLLLEGRVEPSAEVRDTQKWADMVSTIENMSRR